MLSSGIASGVGIDRTKRHKLNTAGLGGRAGGRKEGSPAIIKNAMQNVPANVPVFWPLRTPNNGYPEVWFYSN